MSGTLRLRGATSGYSELQAPAVAADQTFILPTAGGTLLTTDSPISKLTLELGSASQPSLTFEGDTDTGLYSSGTNTLNLVTGGSNRLTIDSSGRVGINTTSPTKSLDVNGTFRVVNEATFDNDVIVYGDAQLNEEGVKLQSGLITAVQAIGVNSVFRGHTTAGTPYNIDLKANGDAVFLGNVGIGNSSPTYKLSVLTTGTSDTSLHLATTGGASANGDATNSVRFTGGTNTRWANAKYEAFTHIFNANGAEKMRIDSAGNVGIGTSSPIAKLDVRGTAYIGTSLGIDIANPGDYHASANDLVMNGGMTLANTSQGSIFFADSSTGTGEYVGQLNYYHSSDSMAFVTNNGERMRIDSSGQLLLGTTAAGFGDAADNLTIADNGNCGMTIRSASLYAGSLYFADGTSGSANYAGFIDYQHSVDALRFGTGGGQERMRIDSLGRVGIGVVPSAHGGNSLEIHSANSVNSFLSLTNSTTGSGGNAHGFNIIMSNNEARLFNREAGDMSFWTSSSERMRITSAGALQITMGGNGYSTLFRYGTNEDNYIRSGVNGFTSFGDHNGGERMRIDSSGSLLLGTTAGFVSGYQMSVALPGGGGIVFKMGGVSTRTPLAFLNPSGSFVGSVTCTETATTYTTSSDYRLKENVADISDGITRVKQLAPKRFNFIVDTDTTVDGFLAHEAQTVVPEAVTGEKDGEKMQGIDQSKLIPLLTAALQEAIAKIETLETKVAALEAG